MTEERALEILGPAVDGTNSLFSLGHYIAWPAHGDPLTITLDSNFMLEELEAIVWWMRNKRVT